MSPPQQSERPTGVGLIAGAPIFGTEDLARKRFETARAIAAISGIALHQVEGDDGERVYIATKWDLARELRTLDEVAAWLKQVTGCADAMPSRVLRGPGGDHP